MKEISFSCSDSNLANYPFGGTLHGLKYCFQSHCHRCMKRSTFLQTWYPTITCEWCYCKVAASRPQTDWPCHFADAVHKSRHAKYDICKMQSADFTNRTTRTISSKMVQTVSSWWELLTQPVAFQQQIHEHMQHMQQTAENIKAQ